MQRRERLASRQFVGPAAFAAMLSVAVAMTASSSASAALPSAFAEDNETLRFDLSNERWQRFLRASRGRYQALAEKAEMLNWPLFDECIDPRLSLDERRECLRTDVFARVAMESDGMVLDEYAPVLHVLVMGSKPVSAAQRGQFQRLRAEWWPERHTAEQ